jgi:hypothetical protein
MDYYQKYLKYKFKYITFKSQYGGKCELKTGPFYKKKDRPLCQIFGDAECKEKDLDLTQKKNIEILSNDCKPQIANLIRWYKSDNEINDKKKVMAFDILYVSEKNQDLFTPKDYQGAKYTIEDVLYILENLSKYAEKSNTYIILFDKVKDLIKGLPGNYKNFMRFITGLFNKKDEIEKENYKILMSAIKEKFKYIKDILIKNKDKLTIVDEVTKNLMEIIKKETGADTQFMSFIERSIIQELFMEKNWNIKDIYNEIQNELFNIDLTFLNQRIMDIILEYDSQFVFKEKFNSLTIQQIKELFCIIYNSNCLLKFLEFFSKHFRDKIKKKEDIELLLLSPDGKKDRNYYERFLDYFPKEALQFYEELDINYIIQLSRPKFKDVIFKILLQKLDNLLIEKKYVEFNEILNKSENIINKEYFFQKIKNDHISEDYMKAIIQKFLADPNDDKTQLSIKTQLATLMIPAFHYGFVITDDVQKMIDELKNKLKLSDADFYYNQFAIFYNYYKSIHHKWSRGEVTIDTYNVFINKFKPFYEHIKGKNFTGQQRTEINAAIDLGILNLIKKK